MITELSTQEMDYSPSDKMQFRTPEGTEAYAKKHNLDILIAKDNELFLDIDTEDDLYRATVFLGYLKDSDLKIVESFKILRSKSGKWHIIANLSRSFSVPERLLMQAFCGSDRRREYASFINYLNGITKACNILFRPKSETFPD
jgi:hypothetical protein